MAYSYSTFRWLIPMLALAAGMLGNQRMTEACSPPQAQPDAAIPRPGATAVPTATSIVIVAYEQPVLPRLVAGGVEEAIDGVELIGQGLWGKSFWRVRRTEQMLKPQTEYVLSTGNPAVEVTRFTTAAGYDKSQGTAPVVDSLKLWRVRYPASEIGSGDCVFAEYEGAASLQYQPATVPGTPDDSLVTTVTLRPKNGGATPATLTFDGAMRFDGGVTAEGKGMGNWKPYLDPSLEYCVEITTFGYGDVARLPLRNANAVCASVTEVAAPGATLNGAGGSGGSIAGTGGSVDGTGGSNSSGGGCATSGTSRVCLAAVSILLLAVAARKRRATSPHS